MGSQHGQQVGIRGIAEPPHRIHVPLLVQGEAVVDSTVQVDSQLREPEHRPGGGQVLGAVQHDQAAGQLQFPVKPGVQQRSAVHLHASLQPAVGTRGRLWLELEGGRIRMCAQDVEAGGGPCPFGNNPGDQRAVPDDEVLSGPALPGLQFVQAHKARFLQTPPRFVHGVEARRRRADIGAKVLDMVCGGGKGRHGLESRRRCAAGLSSPGCSAPRGRFRRRKPRPGLGRAGGAW